MKSRSSTSVLLVFDGDCAFCTTWVNRLRETLPRFPEATPSQWLDLDAYGLTSDDVAQYVWLITPRRHLAGHLAFAALLRMQPTWGWKLLGAALVLPGISAIASLGYRLIARYRHRLPGGTPACAVTPGTQ